MRSSVKSNQMVGATWLEPMNDDQKHIANTITQPHGNNGHDVHYFIHATGYSCKILRGRTVTVTK